MNIETRIDKRLWESIRINVESRNFTASVLDAMYFLGDLLRQKSGVEADGVALVGQSLGGNSPKLRVNRLQTESEWNVQRGIEQLLRGLYQAIRNPRSHEKFTDNEEDAQSIILFVNYIVKIIDQSRSPFVRSEFIKRVLDQNFVPKQRYADLLVREIPATQKLYAFIDVYRSKQEANPEGLEIFFPVLIESLNEKEKTEVFETVSDELKQTDDEAIIRLNIRAFGKYWPNLEEAARLRIENRLIRSAREGKYIKSLDRCRGGALGTWSTRIFAFFSLKQEMMNILIDKLASKDDESINYVIQYFFSRFNMLMEQPDKALRRAIINGLQAGNQNIFDAVMATSPWAYEKWGEDVDKAISEFQVKEADESEDMPF